MKLDRDINADGEGKYALVSLRKFRDLCKDRAIAAAFDLLRDAGIIEIGAVGTIAEAFPIKLRDKYARVALIAYAGMAHACGDSEYASAVLQMAERAGPKSPFCKKPD